MKIFQKNSKLPLILAFVIAGGLALLVYQPLVGILVAIATVLSLAR